MAVPEKYRTGWRLLGRDDAPLMPHRQAAVQSLQDFHSRSGIAGTFPPSGSNCRVCSWNLTVLSRATFLWCLKHRTCSRHCSGSRGRMQAQGIAVEPGNAG